LTKALIFKEE